MLSHERDGPKLAPRPFMASLASGRVAFAHRIHRRPHRMPPTKVRPSTRPHSPRGARHPRPVLLRGGHPGSRQGTGTFLDRAGGVMAGRRADRDSEMTRSGMTRSPASRRVVCLITRSARSTSCANLATSLAGVVADVGDLAGRTLRPCPQTVLTHRWPEVSLPGRRAGPPPLARPGPLPQPARARKGRPTSCHSHPDLGPSTGSVDRVDPALESAGFSGQLFWIAEGIGQEGRSLVVCDEVERELVGVCSTHQTELALGPLDRNPHETGDRRVGRRGALIQFRAESTEGGSHAVRRSPPVGRTQRRAP